MDGLRWLLLLFGVLVIAGVYLYSRRERDKPPQKQAAAPRRSPILGNNSSDSSESDAADADSASTEIDADVESESSKQSPQKS